MSRCQLGLSVGFWIEDLRESFLSHCDGEQVERVREPCKKEDAGYGSDERHHMY